MKQPISKLPFDINNPNQIGELESGRGVCEVRHSEDTEYIVEACNNYPKAIELLNRVLCKEYISNCGIDWEIDNFLKSIK